MAFDSVVEWTATLLNVASDDLEFDRFIKCLLLLAHVHPELALPGLAFVYFKWAPTSTGYTLQR